jgi:TolB-like protein
LPFANATGDARSDTLALRLGQKTADYLGKYSWLRAIGRSGGGTKSSADPIAAALELSADYVVTADVDSGRDSPRATFHVDDAHSGARVWSQTLAPILEDPKSGAAEKEIAGSLAQSAIFNAELTRANDVGVASLPGHGPQIAAGLVNTIRTTGSIAMVVVTGWLMQRTARRKAFLQVYAGLTVAALLAPTLSATWTAMLIFAVLSGAAYGIFASVDLAIITQVLPTRDSAGRDIGVLAVTGAAPQLIAPAIGGLLIHNLGYGPLFAFAALMTLAVGGVSVLIRSLD